MAKSIRSKVKRKFRAIKREKNAPQENIHRHNLAARQPGNLHKDMGVLPDLPDPNERPVSTFSFQKLQDEIRAEKEKRLPHLAAKLQAEGARWEKNRVHTDPLIAPNDSTRLPDLIAATTLRRSRAPRGAKTAAATSSSAMETDDKEEDEDTAMDTGSPTTAIDSGILARKLKKKKASKRLRKRVRGQ